MQEVPIIVEFVNDNPVALPDSFYVMEDDTLFVPDSLNLLLNDSDEDVGQALTAVIEVMTSNGYLDRSDTTEVELNDEIDGTFIYIPYENYFGEDYFQYTAFDKWAKSNITRVPITIIPVNDAPQITGQLDLETDEEVSITIELSDIIFNDVDNEIEDISFALFDGENYQVEDHTILPDLHYFDLLFVPVQLFDGQDSSEVDTLSIMVNNINDKPQFGLSEISISQLEDFTDILSVQVTDIIEHDGDNLVFTLIPNTVSWVELNVDPDDGIVEISAIQDSSGFGEFILRGDDNKGGVHEEMFTLQISNVNDSPFFNLDTPSITTPEDFLDTLFISVVEYSDADNDISIFSMEPVSVTWADLSLDELTGMVTIVSVPDSIGNGTFTVSADDQMGESNSVTSREFSLVISNVNDAPIFNLSTHLIDVDEDFQELLTVNIEDYFDVEGESSEFSISPSPNEVQHWVNLSMDSNTGEINISAVENGSDSTVFTITAFDGNEGGITSQAFELIVSPINDPVFVYSKMKSFNVRSSTIQGKAIGALDSIFVDIEEDELAYSLDTLNLSPGQNLDIHINEQDKVILTFDTHILNGFETPIFVGDASFVIHATEIDPIQPGEPTTASDTVFIVDKAPPKFDFGVMHSTIAPGFLQFYLFQSEVLESEPQVTLSENALNVMVNPNLSSAPYLMNYKVSESGPLSLEISASDTSENDTTISIPFEIQTVQAKQRSVFSVGTEGGYVLVPETALSSDDIFIITPNRLGMEERNIVVEDASDSFLSEYFSINSSTIEYDTNLEFGFQSETVSMWLDENPGFYRLVNGHWEYLETFVFLSQDKLWCFVDEPGTYVLRKDADRSPIVLPEEFILKQNYPNPFNPRTVIDFDIPYSGNGIINFPAKLIIYDVLGREVTTLMDGELSPGNYSVMWNGKDSHGNNVSSGIYFYSLDAGSYSNARKMILVR